MSHMGYFKGIIKNWYSLEKKTPMRIKEMKEVIRQYDYSKWCGDFDNESEEDKKYLEIEMKKIYKEIY